MNDLQKLIEKEEIQQLKARYFRFLDTLRTSEHENLFTTDASIDVRGSVNETGSESAAISDYNESAILKGGSGWAALVQQNSSSLAATVHAGFMPEIDVLSPDSATGVWAMEDRLWFREGAPHRMLHGFGHYHEKYRKINGSWLIDEMVITRLRVELYPW